MSGEVKGAILESLQAPRPSAWWYQKPSPPRFCLLLCRKAGWGGLQITLAIDLTIILPLSNLDVNVLATALPSRLEIVPPHPEIIHPDRVVFIKVRLGEDAM